MLFLDIKSIKNVKESKKEFQEIAKALRKSRKCIIVTGAGISVSGGIPDFRSSEGLYNLVKKKFPQAIVKGKDLFDATLFRDPVTTKIFYTFMGELKDVLSKASITPTHRFVKNMDTQGKLLRCYTQNIDCLEERLKLSADITNKKTAKIVQLHGDMDRVLCSLCQKTFKFTNEHKKVFKSGQSLPCPSCKEKSDYRISTGKRPTAIGSLRPNIVLYNEHHANGDLINEFANYDISKKPDLLIVMGTSLKVYGIKSLVKRLANVVHNRKTGKVVFINKTEINNKKSWEDVFDYQIISSTDEAVTILQKEVDRLDAEYELRKEISLKKAELKAKGIKYNPRVHKFNELTPDQTILKIEEETGNLIVHIPRKAIKKEKLENTDLLKDELLDDKDLVKKENYSSSPLSPSPSPSPSPSYSSIFSTTSSLSSLSSSSSFSDAESEKDIKIKDHNAFSSTDEEDNIFDSDSSSSSYDSLDNSPNSINLGKLSIKEKQKNIRIKTTYKKENSSLLNENENDIIDIDSMSSDNEENIDDSDNNDSQKNIEKDTILNIKKKNNTISTSKKEESFTIEEVSPISHRLRSRTNSQSSNMQVDLDNITSNVNTSNSTTKKTKAKTKSSSTLEPILLKSPSPKPKTSRRITKSTGNITSIKLTLNTNKRRSTIHNNSNNENIRNILKVGKRNVVPISTDIKKKVSNQNKNKNNSYSSQVNDENLHSLRVNKRIRIK